MYNSAYVYHPICGPQIPRVTKVSAPLGQGYADR